MYASDYVLFYVLQSKKSRVVGGNLGKKVKAPNGNKGKAPNKPQGRKSFQQQARCSLGEVLAAVKLLKEPHRKKVEQAGFGCVFDWVLEGNISRILMCHLMKTIDPSTMKINCGSGRVLEVTREAVHQLFGFPIGGVTPPIPAESGHDDSLSEFKAELGIDSSDSIEPKDLRSMLAELVEDPEKVDLAVKVFFAILYNKMICPGSGSRVGREAAMLRNMDYNQMANMDYCQLVVDELKRAATKYQDSEMKQAGPEGCCVVLSAMYTDCCYSQPHSIMHILTPRAKYLHETPLKAIVKKDMEKHGGKEILNYKFGKLVVSVFSIYLFITHHFSFC